MNKFQEVLQKYLDGVAAADSHLAERMKLENKTIEECEKYILTEVKKLNRQGFADDEIYTMARHYYLEDDLVIENLNAKVVINEETDEEFEKKAKKQTKKEKKRDKDGETNAQLSLFDITL